jgi:SEC-C motif
MTETRRNQLCYCGSGKRYKHCHGTLPAIQDESRAETERSGSDPFTDKAIRALRELYDKARASHELHFVMALMPEFRGTQDAGWSTAHEAVRAYDDFRALIKSLDKRDYVRARVILAFYMHVSEGSGFYEIPKKLLLTVEGKGNNITPFQSLVDRHRKTGESVAPNANRIMKDLIGHATELKLPELADTFRDAFDADVRNAVAHADYIIWSDGLRLRRRNGGHPRVIPWDEFDDVMRRGLNLFNFVRQITEEYVRSYDPPKTIRARMNDDEPENDYTLYFNPKTREFGLKTGGNFP